MIPQVNVDFSKKISYSVSRMSVVPEEDREPGTNGNGLPPLPKQPKPGDDLIRHDGGVTSSQAREITKRNYQGAGPIKRRRRDFFKKD